MYRGTVPAVRENYFLSDFVNSRNWSINASLGVASARTDWTGELVPDKGSISNITSFREDTIGSLYMVSRWRNI